jgi:hypothetical protein
LTVTGSSTLSALTVSGGSNLGPTTISTLNVTGGLGAITVAALTVTGNAAVGGALTITGTSTLNNTVGITGSTAATALSVNAAGTGIGLAVTGNTSQPAVTLTQGAGQNALQAGIGTTAAPSYGFAASPSTGLYAPASNQFALAAGGIDQVRFDGASVLVTSTYRAEALAAGGQVVPATTTATLTFANQLIGGVLSGYSTGTSTFTAPVSGVYLVGVVVTGSSSAVVADSATINVQKNGATVFSFLLSMPVIGFQYTHSGSWIISLLAGNTVRVQATAGTGNLTLAASPLSSLAIHLLSVPS